MTKQERLDAYLDENDLQVVWFARPNSFAWLTGGDNVVDREGDVGVAAVGYDGDGLEVLTNNIEADRLRDEELDDDVVVSEFPWHESSLADALADHGPTPAAADFDVPGFETVDASPLRQPLTEADVEAYRDLGYDTAEAVEAVCRELRPGDVESEVASALRVALSARGVESPVALVGGAERARQYRHYTPQNRELGDYALVSVTAERDGLHASTTRTVAFGDEDDPSPDLAELLEKHRDATVVETTALAATRAETAAERDDGDGGTAGDVFGAIQAVYEQVGYPNEWTRHHQGGAAGFDGREWIATPDHDGAVTTPMAYAWNPTVQGAKSEDTVLVADDGFEVLTTTGQWPTTAVEALEVEGYEFDVTLERPDVLVKDV